MSPLQLRELLGVWATAALLILVVGGCTAGRIVAVGPIRSLQPPLTTVALAPDGGVFADLIGLVLSQHGLAVIDTGATAALLVINRHPANQLLRSAGLEMLRGREVGAVLVVERINGGDGLPQRVHVRLYGTADGAELGGVDWKNSWIRRGVLEAAQEIGTAVAQAAEPASGPDTAASGVEVLSRGGQLPASQLR